MSYEKLSPIDKSRWGPPDRLALFIRPTSSVSGLGLKTDELASLEKKFTNLNLIYSKQEHFFEVDTQGIRVLNILCSDYNYKITSQSMAMEKTEIGGRTIQVQNLVWTLEKQEM